MRRTTYKVAGSDILPALFLTIAIWTLAIVLTLNFRLLFYLDIDWLGLEKYAGMDRETIRRNYDALIQYNQVWFRGGLVFPTLPMSEGGRIHFMEVKRIFDGIQITAVVSCVLAFSCGWVHSRKRGLGWMRISSILCLVIPCVLGTLAAISWNTFFVRFHELVFDNDYWLFDPKTDPVIRMLPDEYFLQCVAVILTLIVIASLICFFLSGNKRNRRSANEDI